jgi:lysozyme
MRSFIVACLTLTALELSMVRQVNAAALAIADRSEGCVLHVYKDPAGIATAGWGHVVGSDVPVGTPITQAQADAWRAQDMARAAAFVEEHVEVELTDNEFSALAEFTYNVGVGNFLGSTLLRLLNKERYDAVPDQLMRWTRAGGKVLPGLVARRKAEVALWNTSGPAQPQTITVASANVTPTPKPSAPSLIERIRAWFHRNAPQPV